MISTMKAAMVAGVFATMMFESADATANLEMCGPQYWFGHAMSGDTEQLATCLEALASKEGSDAWLKQIEVRDEVGCTAIILASINDNLETIKYLHSKGADLDAKCWSGTTALMHAAKRGYTDVVRYLHQNGVDVLHKLTPTGFTAVTYAARYGHMDTLKYLHKIELEFSAKKWKGNAVMWAAGLGDNKLLETLLKQKDCPDINAVDAHGFSAAFWATQRGKLQTLDTLRRAGASLELKSESGMSLLIAAAYNGHVEVCVYLLEQGANIDEEDHSGWTAIMWAALGGKLNVVKVLEDHGSCVKPKQGRWDPVMVASTGGHTDVIEWFLARGHSFTGMNHEGKTASRIAEENGHYEISALLTRMWEINQWHAQKTKAGEVDAASREMALRRQAEVVVAAQNDNITDPKLVELVFTKLKSETEEKERLVRLRESQIKSDVAKAKRGLKNAASSKHQEF